MREIKRYYRAINYFLKFILIELPSGVDFSMRDKYSSKDSSLNGYARTSTNSLKNLFTFLDIRGKNFLDIGSGKGAVVYDAFQLGANISHGLEYNKKLHDIAIKNFKRLNSSEYCISYNVDARSFNRFNDYEVFFLFNPFNSEVYSEVIENLKSQIVNNLMKKWIIAYGKANENAILTIPNIKLIAGGICPFRSTNFRIYQIN